MPTLKKVRSCLRLPISMMPRFSLKLTLARLRTGMDSVGSLLRSAAVITASATLMSFFSTAPVLVGFFRAMSLLHALSCAGFFVRAGRLCLAVSIFGLRALAAFARSLVVFGAGGVSPFAARGGVGLPLRGGSSRRRRLGAVGAGQHRRLPFGPVGGDDDRVRQAFRSAASWPRISSVFSPPVRLHGDLLELGLELLLGELAALQAARRPRRPPRCRARRCCAGGTRSWPARAAAGTRRAGARTPAARA